MKRLFFSFGVLICVFLWILHTAATDSHAPVNAVIGDISFVKKFGHLPEPGTNEGLRIKTHLEYVELILRENSSSYLDKEIRQKRNKLIENLRKYRSAGIFPKNYGRNERSPCFIDRDGNICALGYLVEQSAGRQLAESINMDFQYSEVADMNSPALSGWLKQNGLTREEAATIQPSYDWDPAPAEEEKTNYVSKSYGLSSSVISGLNLTLSGIQLFKADHAPLSSKLGLLGGAAQTTLGLLSLPAKTNNMEGQASINEHKKALSLVNIGIGAGTMLFSSWELLRNKKRKETIYSWDVHGIPLSGKETAIALSLKRKL